MSRWFRHYAGLCRDAKLVSVALKAGQSIERVVWIWAAILESAAEINDDGRYSIDEAEIAYFLRASEVDIGSVVAGLGGRGLIDADRVAKWGDRQFKSDSSAERQKKYRQSRASANDARGHGPQHDDQHRPSDGGVTSLSQSGDAPETETETETELETEKKIIADAMIVDGPPPTIDLKIEIERKKLSEARSRLQDLGQRWNAFAGEFGLPQIEEIKAGSPREVSALARLREAQPYDRIFAKIRGSPFLRGERGRSPCTFDWINNPTNALKILEGNYDEVRQAARR